MWRRLTFIMLTTLGAACQGQPTRHATFVTAARLAGSDACHTSDSKGSSAVVDPATLKRREHFRRLLLGGHCIDEGNSVVLHLSMFSPSPPMTVDASRFTQITIELPKTPQLGESISFEANELTVYVSRGSAAWTDKGAGFFGNRANGRLDLTRLVQNKISVKGRLVTNAKHATERTTEAVTIELDGDFVQSQLAELRRCLGFFPLCPDVQQAGGA